MDTNQFGKISSLHLKAACRDGRTYLQDASFTAPYKIMLPFEKKNGGIQVMQLAASAGIMEGDRQEFSFDVLPGADLEFLSQSYDKIHQMKEGCAKRFTSVHVSSNAAFCFNPQPTIPFKDSAFENQMEINLEDETSTFQMSEIFSCGRYARGEKFAYRFYHNLVEIRRGGHLIYRDNTRYEPNRFHMSGVGMYEGYTHLLNLFLTRPEDPENYFRDVRDYLSSLTDAEGAITELSEGDFAIRVLGHRGQRLEEISRTVLEKTKIRSR